MTSQPTSDGAPYLWGDDRPTPTDAPRVMVYPEGPTRPGRITTPQGDLRFINLRGPLPRCAADYGERMASAMRRGGIEALSRYPIRAIGRTRASSLKVTIARGTKRSVIDRARRRFDGEWTDALSALARGAAVDEEVILETHMLPQTLGWLEATWSRLPGASGPLGLMGRGSCGEVVARTAGHGLLFGKNIDFPADAGTTRYTTAVAYHPDTGHSFVSVTTAGFVGAHHLAMNAMGVALSATPVMPSPFDHSGVPYGPGACEAMRSAADLDQAIAILRQWPHCMRWRYVLCEGDSGRCVCVELGPAGEVRTPLILQDAVTSPTTMIPALIQGRAAGPDALKRVVAAPSGITNILSVIFEPRQRRVWVAAGPAPKSRGWFIPLELTQRRELRPATALAPLCSDPEWWISPHGQAMNKYRQVAQRHVEGEGAEHLLFQIEHALALWPHDADLHVLCGLLAIKSERALRAQGALRRALDLEDRAERRAEIGTYLGWALELGGEERAARALYKQLRREGVLTRSLLNRFSRFSERQARRLDIDFRTATAR